MRGFYLLLDFNLLFIVSIFLGEANINEAKSESTNKVYIVYMGGPSSRNGAGRNDHAQLLSELMERFKKTESVVQTYKNSLLGFAARLSEEEAKSIAQRPGVVSVFLDGFSQLHTTRSWDFLKTSSHSQLSWPTPADTIIGILDTGIWPEHLSFSDENMGRIPPRWKGKCLSGKNSTYSFKCNRKLIGARYYDDPHAPMVTARDFHGHGTHVASTAAGMPIRGASYNGLAKGTARGGSPSSRIAVYRVCADESCADSSILKAFDDAIADGVDVLSISLGGKSEDFLTDSVAIGAFHAVEKGITVVCSASNEGPSPGTVENAAPWLVTVAATTIDRDFEVDIVLGNSVVIKVRNF
ncbi:co(2)-response secreted protease [Phtheirospermum japonicum]|uniref:Co(2)-response secreted protease n=1 Tax=Phtheirospermum japonicum TaxID=374723 RepID=A0A830C8H5_9LAMI|nr:co(2)-response secreted protease [Phtheirospermum japonicum]